MAEKQTKDIESLKALRKQYFSELFDIQSVSNKCFCGSPASVLVLLKKIGSLNKQIGERDDLYKVVLIKPEDNKSWKDILNSSRNFDPRNLEISDLYL